MVKMYSLEVFLSQFWTSLLFISSFKYCFLTCIQVFQEAGKVVRFSHLFKNFPQFVVIHVVKGFSIVNEAEVHAFLEFPCFFCHPTDAGNLISGSSAFPTLDIWKFSVHVLLKLRLEDSEHYFASMWNEYNCMVVWNSLALPFFGIGMKTDLPVMWPLLNLPNLLAYCMQHFNSIIF